MVDSAETKKQNLAAKANTKQKNRLPSILAHHLLIVPVASELPHDNVHLNSTRQPLAFVGWVEYLQKHEEEEEVAILFNHFHKMEKCRPKKGNQNIDNLIKSPYISS